MYPRRFLDWIDPEKLDWYNLSDILPYPKLLEKYRHLIRLERVCENPHAISFIEKIADSLDTNHWNILNCNPAAIHLLEANPDKINWEWISENPSAIHLLEANQDKICWRTLCYNTKAIHLLEKKIARDGEDWIAYNAIFNKFDGSYDYDEISWMNLSGNTAAGRILEMYPHKIHWDIFSMYQEDVQLLEKFRDNIVWPYLSSNPHAIPLLEKNRDKIEWNYISALPQAIHLIEENIDKINLYNLGENPAAIHIIEKNIYKINRLIPDAYYILASNSAAIHLLEKNRHKINYTWLSRNPAITEWSRIKYLHKQKILQKILIKDLSRYLENF